MPSVSSGRQDENPAELLAEAITRIQRTRLLLRRGAWQWLVIWVVACLGAGVSGFSERVAPWYWAVALPIALGLTAFVSRRVESRKPVRKHAWPHWLIGGLIIVGNLGGSWLLPAGVVGVWVWVVFGIGFAAFAVLEGQRKAAALLIGLAAISAILGLASEDTFALYPYLGFLFAGGLAAMAVGLWVQETQS